MKNRAFTLIELLVVVLIIGILVAIAVPQYQKAVEKSKAMQALSIMKSFKEAIRAYNLTNNKFPTSFNDLDINMAGWTGNEQWSKYPAAEKSISNGEWSLQLYPDSYGNLNLYCGRLSGKYQGGGFTMPILKADGSSYENIIWCAEIRTNGVIFKEDPGDYCVKIFNATEKGHASFDYYSMP